MSETPTCNQCGNPIEDDNAQPFAYIGEKSLYTCPDCEERTAKHVIGVVLAEYVAIEILKNQIEAMRKVVSKASVN